MIKKLWKNRTKAKNIDIWKWQINQILLIKNKYGEDAIYSQLNQACSKGWNSIDIVNYEKFNKVESEANKSKALSEKRIENMKIHAKAWGKESSYYHDPTFMNAYKKLLRD